MKNSDASPHRCFRTREILVFDSTGKLEHSIAFSEADLKL
jgi:hypothetical protein